MIEPVRIPDRCNVAFKEWSGVCRALEAGRQVVLLRKGGIAEDPGTFRPEHEVFWLYPTWHHQQEQALREEAGLAMPPAPPEAGTRPIRLLAVVTHLAYVESLADLESLSPLHVWTDEVIRARFAYRRPGIWVLGVRMFRRPSPWYLPDRAAYEGCKSWLPLEEAIPTEGVQPVLDAEEYHRRIAPLEGLAASAPAGPGAASP